METQTNTLPALAEPATGEALDLEAAAQYVRTIAHFTTKCIVMSGDVLLRVKKQVGHGSFREWLKVSVAMSERTAERFIGAAKFADGKSDIVSYLEPTGLYLLSAKSTPAEAVTEVVARIRSDRAPSTKEIRKIITAAKYPTPAAREALRITTSYRKLHDRETRRARETRHAAAAARARDAARVSASDEAVRLFSKHVEPLLHDMEPSDREKTAEAIALRLRIAVSSDGDHAIAKDVGCERLA